MKHLILSSFFLFSVFTFCGTQQVFAQQSEAEEIIITEIMYNPPEAGQDSLEFLELYNVNPSSSVNLSGYYFSDGVEYVFPAGTSIASEGFVLLAKDSVAFESVFGMPALEWTSMSLFKQWRGYYIENT